MRPPVRPAAQAAFALLVPVLLLLAGTPASAADPVLELPIDCQPGRDCWIVNYVDHDPDEGVRDYACGTATYNEPGGQDHNGTDFAVRDLGAMAAGVAVRAAAAGAVAGLRDGVDDGLYQSGGLAAVKGRECGNGVLLRHGDGWETQYCHLRKGSVAVTRGQTVAVGHTLGLVGLSGMTEYPHVHITVRKDGQVVDPFVGRARVAACGPGEAPLWSKAAQAVMAYPPLAIALAGFSDRTLSAEAARAGGAAAERLGAEAAGLFLFADLYQVRAGDVLTLRLRAPDGKLLGENATTFERKLTRAYRTLGIRRPAAGWPKGAYVGEIAVERRAPPPEGPARRTETRAVEIR